MSAEASALEILAAQGFADDPLERLTQAADECDRLARSTGDARYPALEQLLRAVADQWPEQGLPSDLVARRDDLVKRELPAVLQAPDGASGYAAARELDAAMRGLS